MKNNCNTPENTCAYIVEYLPHMQRAFYAMLVLADEKKEYDPISVLQCFMETSEKAAYISRGNPRGLNATGKQLYGSVEKDNCEPYTTSYSLDLLHWLARIYPYYQRKYNIPFSDMATVLPAKKVALYYNPLHETSISNACVKLKESFDGPHTSLC